MIFSKEFFTTRLVRNSLLESQIPESAMNF